MTFKFKAGNQEIELTESEARSLYDDLHRILGPSQPINVLPLNPVQIIPAPYPVYQTPVAPPRYTPWFGDIICQTS